MVSRWTISGRVGERKEFIAFDPVKINLFFVSRA